VWSGNGSRKIQTYQNKAKNLCCHLGWMNRRRFCLQKGGSQEYVRASLCSVVGTGTAQKDVAVDSRCDVGYDEQC